MANRLALELTVDSNPLLKGLEQANRSLMKFTDAAADAGKAVGGSLGRAIDNFGNFAKGGASAAGLLAGGFAAAASAAVALTASAGREIEALDKLSQKTGIALNTLQNWTVIMAENDFQAESLTASMRTLSKQIVEAKDPSSKAAAAFEEMGLAAKDLGSAESVFRAVADRFKDMADGPEKARMAIELFGKSGLELIPILNRGSKAFDESRDAAERFAVVLRSNQVEALKAADDAMDRVGVAAKALQSQLGAVFAPSVEKGADALAEIMGFLARATREVDTAMDTLAIRMTHIALAGKELAKVIFSKDAINGDAWRQALTNISLIDKEAAKLIAKRRDLADMGPVINVPEVVVGPNPNDAIQEALGRKLLAKHLHELVLLKAEQNAQEALGRVIVQMTQNHLNELTSEQKAQEELGRSTVRLTQLKVEAMNKELDAYFDTEKGLQVVTAQEEAGFKIVQEATEAWKRRNDALEMAVDHARVLDEQQQAMFQTEKGLFGASDTARRVRMQLIEAEGVLKRQKIEEEIFDTKKRNAAILNLDIELDTKRRQAIQQFPNFFQQQMQAMEQSNSFSIALIANTWTSGLANAIVNGGNFAEQALKSTQVALLQGVMQYGLQKLMLLANYAASELAIWVTLQSSKLAAQTATDATIVAGTAATATATTSIWTAAGIAITGTFGALTGAIMGFFTATLIPFFAAIGSALMTFLAAIAAAASSTIFGIPYGIAILAGVAIIGAAIGSLMAFAFADGGIATGPTLGMMAEAGSSEAVIPLNKRGAAFMREAMGGTSGSGSTTVIVELDGRQIAKSVFDAMPGVMRVRGISA